MSWPPPELTEAEDWVRDVWSLGGPHTRQQMQDHWDGPTGRKHRLTLQHHRPLLLQAVVDTVKAELDKLPK
jgi:hypothetical protein